MHQEIDAELDAIARDVVDCAFVVHKALGPGLLESAYAICLGLEFTKRGISFAAEVPMDVIYEQQRIESAYRLDFLVANRLVVELKSVEKLLPIHKAQVLTYLRLSGLRLGLLINFNAPLIRDGISRLVI
ncbi:MAG: GxxExxY protein [Betaproteobacteria bacterium]|nr:GxxExxY protein [Betaproteobacteria bacterium]